MDKTILLVLLTALFLGCNPTPGGYTPEAWAKIQREHPNFAQEIQWINRDSTRREIRAQYLYAHGGKTQWSDGVFAGCADPEMLDGQKDAFAHLVVATMQHMINRGILGADEPRWRQALARIEQIKGYDPAKVEATVRKMDGQ